MVKKWPKIGTPKILAESHGRQLAEQLFINPQTGKTESYTIFIGSNFSTILPLTPDGRVVAIREYKQGCDRVMLQLPGGNAKSSDESPEEIARRELQEETGYATSAEKVILLGPSIFPVSRGSDIQCFCFLALDCEKISETNLDSTEEIETELIPFRQWLELCQTEVVESQTLATTFRAFFYLMDHFLDYI